MARGEKLLVSRFWKFATTTVSLAVFAIASTLPLPAQIFTALHSFTGGADGAMPYAGLSMDRAGNLYGTTAFGGAVGSCFDGLGCGTVYKLSHVGSGWILRTLYTFRGGTDGALPGARVIIGPDGNLYGTTAGGGGGNCAGSVYSGCGTVFKLTLPPNVCSAASCPWTETVLYRFQGGSDGAAPLYGNLLFDHAGNIYGTASTGGFIGSGCIFSTGCGVVFEIMPGSGGWTEAVLHTFTGGTDGVQPFGGLILDAQGNLYGTTARGGGSLNYGTVYELTRSGSGWTETILHSLNSFSGGDGSAFPYGGLIFDAAGNLYGTSDEVYGTVFELTPGSGGWTFNTLYELPGNGVEISGCYDGVIMDAAGDLYGTTHTGGPSDFGTVFELLPINGGGWRYQALHNFTDRDDGAGPFGGVIQDSNGNLFGAAADDGAGGSGVVFEITP